MNAEPLGDLPSGVVLQGEPGRLALTSRRFGSRHIVIIRLARPPTGRCVVAASHEGPEPHRCQARICLESAGVDVGKDHCKSLAGDDGPHLLQVLSQIHHFAAGLLDAGVPAVDLQRGAEASEDCVGTYHALGRDQIGRILDIQLGLLRKRLADRRLSLELSKKALDFLAERGYDPQYGARPLKRLIQREVQDPLAMRILQGEFGEGKTVKVELAADGQSLSFS